MPGLLQQGNDFSEQSKSLFQAGYRMLYEGGAFDTLRQQAEQDPIGAVSQFLSNIATQLFQESGETNTTTVITALIGLLGEIVEALNETGLEIKPEDLETIIGTTINQTLNNVPELGEQMLSDPNVQQAMQDDPRIQKEMAQRQSQQSGAQ